MEIEISNLILAQSSFTSLPISYWFFLILAAVLGYVVAQFMGKSSEVENGKNPTDFEKEIKNLERKLKDKEKLHKISEDNRNALKAKFDELQAAQNETGSATNELQNTINAKEKIVVDLENDKVQLNNKYERLYADHEKLKSKYSSITKEDKNWKSEIDSLKIRLNDVSKKHNFLVDRNEELKNKLSERKNIDEEIDLLRKENKGQKNKIKQITQEKEYWEKQHYNIQHELTASKKTLEEALKAKEETLLFLNGSKIEKQNLTKMIEEYKTKFIEANNKYHELISKN